MKTSELSGKQLDWAVFQAEYGTTIAKPEYTYKPSSYWALGGPIIEREKIALMSGEVWSADVVTGWDNTGPEEQGPWPIIVCAEGPTPLIAAMRCYVASKLGEEVEVPTELLGELI